MSSLPRSFLGDPMTKEPAGIGIISGHDEQSRRGLGCVESEWEWAGEATAKSEAAMIHKNRAGSVVIAVSLNNAEAL
jgi:hypothetical protein